jgi:NAD(P)-dependent dehydrogenase (short-subunit alcohol dehydrogenase family)
MDLLLTGKRCVVLGASRGIGRAIATGLAAEGALLAICGRDAESLVSAADDARAALGGLDVLVHNASALAVARLRLLDGEGGADRAAGRYSRILCQALARQRRCIAPASRTT